MSLSRNQSNPFSTGGGGVSFETRIQASFLLMMLVSGCLPCLPAGYKAQKIKLQGKYVGYDTDDLMLVAGNGEQAELRLYGQIKHEISIGDGGKTVFAEVIKDFWSDFNRDGFEKGKDVLALITGPLSNTDITNVRPLLEWARHCETSDEFLTKVSSPGFSSKAKTRKLQDFRGQIQTASGGKPVSDEEFWQFLKSFHLIGYDLDSANSPTERLLESLLQSFCNEQPQLVWSRLVTHIQDVNQNAGTITPELVPQDILALFNNGSLELATRKLRVLADRSKIIFEIIRESISGFHVHRPDYLFQLSEKTAIGNFVFVTGERGTGKSSLVKGFVRSLSGSAPVFYVRAEDFDKPNLNDVFSSMGVHLPFSEIDSALSLIQEKYLVIESLEKILELECDRAFTDFLQLLRFQSGWKVVATGRAYAYQQLIFNYFQPMGVGVESLSVGTFSDQEIKLVIEKFPALGNLYENDSLKDLLKIPFYAEIAVRVINQGGDFQSGESENTFREKVWQFVIANERDRKNGMPIKRKHTFIEVAKERAKKMLYRIPEAGFDAEALLKLEEDDLIVRDREKSLVCPAHDVFEDWALEEFIQREYVVRSDKHSEFLCAIGNEPAINRAFRLWLYQKLVNREDVLGFIKPVLLDGSIPSYWQDEVISAVLQGPDPGEFLRLLEDVLLKDNCALLFRFLFILRITCQRPNPLFLGSTKNGKSSLADSLFLVPFGKGWKDIIKFLLDHFNCLPESSRTHVIQLLHEWSNILNINIPLPEESRAAGLLALNLLASLKDYYRREKLIKKLLPVLIKTAQAIEQEFSELVENDILSSKSHGDRPHYADTFSELLLQGVEAAFIAKTYPDLLIRVARHEWYLEPPDEDNPFHSHMRLDIDGLYGLEKERYFFPATGMKGPFMQLLNHHPRKGLDFIIELFNRSVEKFSQSEYGKEHEGRLFRDEMTIGKVFIELADGSGVEQYASPHLWKGYRGLSTVPYSLQSALMALENWLISYVTRKDMKDDQIGWLYDYLLRNSNSVLTTSVLVSVATGHPYVIGPASLPLLRTPELYHLDLTRMVSEMGGNEPNWFGTMMYREPMAELYVEERRAAAMREWRKENLETLLVRLQLHEKLREEALLVVDSLIAKSKLMPDNESIRFLLHRSDTRSWKARLDEERNRIVYEVDKEIDADLKVSQQSFNEEHKDDGKVTSLMLWGRKIFEKECTISDAGYYSNYDDAIATARELTVKLENQELKGFPEMAIGAIARTAAVCLRDYSKHLTEEQAAWCIEVVLQMAMLIGGIDSPASHDKSDHSGSAACASVLPIIFDFIEDDADKIALKQIIATALMHRNANVQTHAALGIREYLWPRDPGFAVQCVYAAIEYAAIIESHSDKFRMRFIGDEKENQRQQEEWDSLIAAFKDRVVRGELSYPQEMMNVDTHSPWYIHLPLLMIPFGSATVEHAGIIDNVIRVLFDDEFDGHSSERDENLPPDVIAGVENAFVEHLYADAENSFGKYRALIMEGCRRAPGIVRSIQLHFTVIAEKRGRIDYVWKLWGVLSPAILNVIHDSTEQGYRGRHDEGRSLVRGFIFADTPWRKNEYEVQYIGHGKELINQFVSSVGNNKDVLEGYASLLFYFPKVFSPQGILLIADIVRNDEVGDCIGVSNSSFYLERVIQHYLQVEESGALKRDIYDACKLLLTSIIENASARAYYLREHLIRTRRILA